MGMVGAIRAELELYTRDHSMKVCVARVRDGRNGFSIQTITKIIKTY